MSELTRGTVVTVVALRGVRLQRRVWEDVGSGVLVCSEEDYRRALRLGEEPQAAGFPKQDVLILGEHGDGGEQSHCPPP